MTRNHYAIVNWQQFFFLCCSVAKSCLTLCDPMDCSTPGFPVLHYLPEFVQTHVHQVGDAIQPSHPLSSPSPFAFNLSQHQGLFQWIFSSLVEYKVMVKSCNQWWLRLNKMQHYQHQSFSALPIPVLFSRFCSYFEQLSIILELLCSSILFNTTPII